MASPFPDYEQALKQTFGPACNYAQVENGYGQDRVHRTTTTVVLGSRSDAGEILATWEDSKLPNTSYVERLNLRLRRSCRSPPSLELPRNNRVNASGKRAFIAGCE